MTPFTSQAQSVKTLLAHRLPADDPAAAQLEWYSILNGQHSLWDGVSEPYKQVCVDANVAYMCMFKRNEQLVLFKVSKELSEAVGLDSFLGCLHMRSFERMTTSVLSFLCTVPYRTHPAPQIPEIFC